MATESEKKISELAGMIAAVRADKHARHDSLTLKAEQSMTDSIKDLSSQMVEMIIEGSKPCECERAPHGMVQYTAVKGKPLPYFEVGCLSCEDKRSQGFTRDNAVSNWNSREFIK